MVYRDGKVHYSASSPFLFCWLSLGLVIWSRLSDLFVFQHPREVCASHSWGRILGFAYNACSYDQWFAQFPVIYLPHPSVSNYYYITNCEFFLPALVDGLSLESEWQQVSSSFHLTDFNNVVVWMVSARPPISNSFSPFTKPLGIVPSAPITIGITVTFMFHSFFSSQTRSKYLSLFFISLIFVLG